MEIHTSPRHAPCPRGQPLRSMEHHREVAGEAPIVQDPGGQLGRGRQWSWAAAAVDSGAGGGSRTPVARVRVPPPSPRREDERVRDRVSVWRKNRLRDGATGAWLFQLRDRGKYVHTEKRTVRIRLPVCPSSWKT